MPDRTLSSALFLVLTTLSPLSAPTAVAQPPSERGSERFRPLHWLIGEWQGYGIFSNDTTYIHKRFSYEVGGMFLVERTMDVFPPAEPTTEFQIHQDMSIYYRDGDSYAVKGFFVESFVWSSAVTVSGDTVVVETRRIENAPSGMRGRVTLVREGAETFGGRSSWPLPEATTGRSSIP